MGGKRKGKIRKLRILIGRLALGQAHETTLFQLGKMDFGEPLGRSIRYEDERRKERKAWNDRERGIRTLH